MKPTITDGDVETMAPELLDQSFIKALVDAENGEHVKNASTIGNGLIKRRIRESGVQRRIQPFVDLKVQDLPYQGSEILKMIEEMEPDQAEAVCLNYNDSADIAFYRGDFFETTFFRISTRKFSKNVWQLAAYKNNLREIVLGNMLKDIHTAEDVQYFKGIDQIVGDYDDVGASGEQQSFEIFGRISRANYAENLLHLLEKDLNNAIFVTNRSTGILGIDLLVSDSLISPEDLSAMNIHRAATHEDEARVAA